MIRNVPALVALSSLAAFAQPAAQPAFEVASIRVSEPGKETIQAVPGSLTMRHVRMNACIRWAYSVPDFQITGGPAWMSEVWFDISAKAAAPVKQDELRVMLQTLLAERFKLTVHRQTKEMSTLVMTVGKNGHKLKPIETDAEPEFKTGKLTLNGQGATLAQLTEFLSKELRHPVIDQTGLTGRFNYFLDINSYVTEEIRKSGGNGPPPEAPSIIAQAMQAQLGLKIDSKKMPLEMIVIDNVEKTPTEN